MPHEWAARYLDNRGWLGCSGQRSCGVACRRVLRLNQGHGALRRPRPSPAGQLSCRWITHYHTNQPSPSASRPAGKVRVAAQLMNNVPIDPKVAAQPRDQCCDRIVLKNKNVAKVTAWLTALCSLLVLTACQLGHTSYYLKDPPRVVSTPASPLGDGTYGKTSDRLSEHAQEKWPCKPYDSVFSRNCTTTKAYRQRSLISNICTISKTRDVCGPASLRTSNQAQYRDGQRRSFDRRLSMAAIEFNDDGVHWKPDQVDHVEREIERISLAQIAGHLDSEGIVLFVFIHGWRQNASEGSSNLLAFRRWARMLASDTPCSSAALESPQSRCAPRHVLAVYIGWRGDSLGLTNPLTRQLGLLGRIVKTPQLLTFWTRKRSAKTLASTHLTTTIYRLLRKMHAMDEIRRDVDVAKHVERATSGLHPNAPLSTLLVPASKSVLVGHSFGAKALEHALAQSFVGARMMSQRLMSDDIDDQIYMVNSITNDLSKLESSIDSFHLKIGRLQVVASNLRMEESGLSLTIHGLDIDIHAKEKQISEIELALENYRRDQENFRPLDDITSCEAYDQDRVAQCGSLQRQGLCAIREVNCIYASYRCSIQAKLAALGPEDSRRVRGRVCDPLDIVSKATFAGHSANWIAFDQRLHEFQDGDFPSIEPPAEQSSQSTAFAAVTHLIEEMDRPSLPNYPVTFISPPFSGDPTKAVGAMLVKTLGHADKDMSRISMDLRNELRGMKAEEEAKYALGNQKDVLLNSRRALSKDRQDLLGRIGANESERKDIKAKIEALNTNLQEHNAIEFDARQDLLHNVEDHLRPPADLVLLLNPATEAMSSFSLINAMDQVGSTAMKWRSRPDQPWIVSITSKADRATRQSFPLGVTVGRAFGVSARYGRQAAQYRTRSAQGDGCDPISVRRLLSRTAGHLEEMVSHRVRKRKDSKDRESSQSFVVGGAKKGEFGIVRKRSACPQSDYWVVSAEDDFIENHWNVFTPDVFNILLRLVEKNVRAYPRCVEFDTVTRTCKTAHLEPDENATATEVAPLLDR